MTWDNLRTEIIEPAHGGDVSGVVGFLKSQGLGYDPHPDFLLVIHDESGEIVATGSLAGRLVKHFAVSRTRRGDDLSGMLLSRLYDLALDRGIRKLFIVTTPVSSWLFEMAGARRLASTPDAVLLEFGVDSIDTYLSRVRSLFGETVSQEAAAIVMNANPFSLGHRHLVLTAAASYKRVIVFVVSEDRSAFPAVMRFNLVREGTKDIDNVVVAPTEDYAVSSVTFPKYFLRVPDQAARIQAELDATLFAERIAPSLGITARVVGEEPYCETTALYNKAMQDAFLRRGIRLIVVPRFCVGGEAVSASRIRKALKEDDWELLATLVPPTTLQALRSPEARPVIEKLRLGNAAH